MYDVNSKHADDFINHEEILETLAYADANKNNRELIEALIDKAALRKGLSHREAAHVMGGFPGTVAALLQETDGEEGAR